MAKPSVAPPCTPLRLPCLQKLPVLLPPLGNRNATPRALLVSLQRALAPIAVSDDALMRVLVIASAVPGVFCWGVGFKEWRTITDGDVAGFLADLRGALRHCGSCRSPR